MRDVVVQTANVKRLVNLAHTLLYRSRGTPGIGMVSGPVGLGKTTATQHVCLNEDAVWVEALPDWTPRWMTADLAAELGAERAATTEKNFRAIIGSLRETRRAIFIDEADRLCRHLHLAETLRAIHDATNVPLILIGMANLPLAVHRLPQLHSRVAHWVEFRPCDLRDVRLMADELSEVEIGEDLLRALHEQTAGSARAIRVALERVETVARRRNKRRMALTDLPDNFEFTYARRGQRGADGAPAADDKKPALAAVGNATA